MAAEFINEMRLCGSCKSQREITMTELEMIKSHHTQSLGEPPRLLCLKYGIFISFASKPWTENLDSPYYSYGKATCHSVGIDTPPPYTPRGLENMEYPSRGDENNPWIGD